MDLSRVGKKSRLLILVLTRLLVIVFALCITHLAYSYQAAGNIFKVAGLNALVKIDLFTIVEKYQQQPIYANYPKLRSQISNNPYQKGIDGFNKIVTDIAQQYITSFKNNINQDKAKEYNLFYSIVIIKADHHLIVGVRFEPLRGAYKTLNYDLTENKQIQLSDLFIPNANYLTLFSQYTDNLFFKNPDPVYKRMDLPKGDKEVLLKMIQPDSVNYANWNVSQKGFFISFNNINIGSYTFYQNSVIPFSILENIIRPDSAIGCIASQGDSCIKLLLQSGGLQDIREFLRQPSPPELPQLSTK